MAHKIVAIQVEFVGEVTKLTALGQSPRGTKIRLKQVQVDVPREDKQAFEIAVDAAIKAL